MKTLITREIFETTQFNPSLIVVQKEKTFSNHRHTSSLHVYATIESKVPMYTLVREITADKTSFWKTI